MPQSQVISVQTCPMDATTVLWKKNPKFSVPATVTETSRNSKKADRLEC